MKLVFSGVGTPLENNAPVDGFTMTGPLILAEYPSTEMQAVNMGYVDINYSAMNLRVSSVEGNLNALVTDPVAKTYVDTQDALKLDLTGGTLTGLLSLSGAPTVALHAATKAYVDSADSGLNTRVTTNESDITALTANKADKSYVDSQDTLKLNLAGGTLTGALTLSGAPTVALHAATKSYVDTATGLKLNLTGGTLTGALTLSGAPTVALHAATKGYVDAADTALDGRLDTAEATIATLNTDAVTKAYVNTQDALKVAKAGDVMTGLLTLSADPTANMHAATKQYADARLPLAGGTMTGFLTLSGAPTTNNHAATKTYVDTADTALSARVTATESTISSLNSDPTTKTYVDTQTATRVAKTGDTMTGLLVLSGAPTLANHAATKTYVDTAAALKLALAGGTMTGPITLSGAPTLSLHAATKAYADLMVPLAGGTMTGYLNLSAAPTVGTHATTKTYVDGLNTAMDTRMTSVEGTVSALNANPVTKTYVDTADALKLAKAGDTMTGFLTLSADPTAAMHASTKQYTDTKVSTHAADAALHLTAGQNTFLDAVTATATEVNYLSGTTSNVQTQISAKLPLAGGTMTGSLIMNAAASLTVNKAPVVATDAVNKSYVDGLIQGLKWKAPIADSNLIAVGLNTPPASPVAGYSYIVGTAPTGAWVGKASRLMTYTGSAWVDVLGRAIAIGDRVGVGFEVAAGALDVSVSAYDNKILVISTVSPLAYTQETNTENDTTLVTDSESYYFGSNYTYTTATGWVKVSSNINFSTGTALLLSGAVLGVNLAAGLEETSASGTSKVRAKLYPSGGLMFTEDGTAASTAETASVGVVVDGSTVVLNAGALAVSSALQTSVTGKLNKAGDTMTGALVLSGAPTLGTHATTKTYTDTAVATKLALAGGTLTGALTLSDAPTVALHAATKAYADLMVPLAGGTMTGLLVLSGAPTLANHATTKTYVDAINTALDARLDTAEATLTTLNTDAVTKAYVDTADALKVAKAGDTLTGFLTLHAAPTATLHAASKGYVDTAAALKLNLTGGTLTGALTLSGAPTVALHAATKAYADLMVPLAGGTMTGLLSLSAAPTANLHAATKAYVDGADSALNTRLTTAEGTVATLNSDPVTKAYVNTQDALKLALAGGAMTGALTLSGAPTVALHAATKAYADKMTPLAGGTMTGFLTLSAAPTANLHAATKLYVDSADSALDLRLDAAEATIATLNTSPVTKTYVDTQDALKLPLAGGTMTGLLVLSGAPTLGTHATTKTYVDTATALKLNLTGGTLTGALTLSGAPTVALHAATKAYADTMVPLAGGTMTGLLTLSGAPTLAAHATTKTYVDTAVATKLPLAGGTLTGALTLSGAPTLANHAATKAYVDAVDTAHVAKAGDTMTGPLVLSGDPTLALHAVAKQYLEEQMDIMSIYNQVLFMNMKY